MHWIIMPYIDCLGYTAQALEDCAAQSIGDVKILAIDNGSREHFERHGVAFWRHNPPLPSLAATWNRALTFVWDAGGDHALVVNNDVRLHAQVYEALVRAQAETGAWFLSACNVAPLGVPAGDILPWDEDFLRLRGGPDFSCFLMTWQCHRHFHFDEGFIPAYHEDNDYHRRLELAGLGEKIFSLSIPYLHYGSATCNRSPEVRATWGDRFKASQEYYVQKWGGLPHHETFQYPFNQEPEGDSTYVAYTGQGKPGYTLQP